MLTTCECARIPGTVRARAQDQHQQADTENTNTETRIDNVRVHVFLFCGGDTSLPNAPIRRRRCEPHCLPVGLWQRTREQREVEARTQRAEDEHVFVAPAAPRRARADNAGAVRG